MNDIAGKDLPGQDMEQPQILNPEEAENMENSGRKTVVHNSITIYCGGDEICATGSGLKGAAPESDATREQILASLEKMQDLLEQLTQNDLQDKVTQALVPIVEKLDKLKNCPGGLEEANKNIQALKDNFEKSADNLLTSLDKKVGRSDLDFLQQLPDKVALDEMLKQSESRLQAAIPDLLGSRLSELNLENRIGNLEEKAKSALDQLADLKKLAENLPETLADKIKPGLKDLASSLGQRLDQQQQKNEELQLELADKNSLESSLKSKEDEIRRLTRDLETSSIRANEAERKLASSLTQLEQASQENSAFATERIELENWQKLARLYEPLREALGESEFFRDLADRKGMLQPGAAGLFACMRSLGESRDFLEELHKYATEKKQGQGDARRPIQSDEQAVYKSLNQCYRHIWDVDFDVFIMPGEQSLENKFERTQFVQLEAIHMPDPRDTDRRYVHEVYVPILRNRNKRTQLTAQVKAGNM